MRIKEMTISTCSRLRLTHSQTTHIEQGDTNKKQIRNRANGATRDLDASRAAYDTGDIDASRAAHEAKIHSDEHHAG